MPSTILASSPEDYSTTGEIRYLNRLELYKTEKPYEVTFHPINVDQPAAQRTNLSLGYSPVSVRDFSSTRDAFSTDIQGFELDSFHTSLSPADLKNLETVESQYYQQAKEWLKMKYNASHVYIFDTTIRQSKKAKPDETALLRNQQILGTSTDVHVDQSPRSVHRRVRHCFPDEGADFLQNRRVRVINIWRPLVFPTHTNPLAMCDWRSTAPADFTLADHKTPVWEGESLQVYHNPAHQWWFAKEMKEDDVILLKMYDSEAQKPGSKIALCTPHCSFDWTDAPEGVQPRQSMEIRAIVVSD